jgi:hypothetical protein
VGEGVGGAAWDALKSAPTGLLTGRRVDGCGKCAGADGRNERAELAGGEGVEGAEAVGEFGGG